MKIAFISASSMNFTVDTPDLEPLGGSESAMCYLARDLAQLGHEVTMFCKLGNSQIIKGVMHRDIGKLNKTVFKDLDAVVVQNTVKTGIQIKKYLNKNTKLLLWTQHASNQPANEPLKEEEVKKLYDGFIFISYWQFNWFMQTFQLNPQKCWILRNAVSPHFINLFKDGESVLSKKSKAPLLVYTSTPFRGLDILLDVFPEIKRRVPDAELRIYSSMKVYQLTDQEKNYKELYNKCKKMNGVKYIGSISQKELAKEIIKATFLAYPNTFEETSCIAAMEAMAAGLGIVTSNLGALSETTGGFAHLIATDNKGDGIDWEKYKEDFTEVIIQRIQEYRSEEYQQKIIRQVNFANAMYTWKGRAKEWELWLQEIITKR